MVVGNTSKYVEGFESFTADDEMMLANLKQAVNYTKANMAISDVDKELSNVNRNNNNNSPPPVPKGRTINSDIPIATKSKNNTIERKAPTLPRNNISNKNNKNNKNNNNNNNNMVTNMGGNKGGMKSNNMNNDMDIDDDMNDNMNMDNDMNNDMDNDMDMDNDEDIEEGFQGSQHIECQTLRKMLIALLITFLGYMVILSFTNNLIPISSYAPHLKPFKHFIYGGLFFLIIYLCLEVF